MGIMSQPKYNKIEFKILNAGVWGLYSSSVHLGPWTFEWNVTRVYIAKTIFLILRFELLKRPQDRNRLYNSWISCKWFVINKKFCVSQFIVSTVKFATLSPSIFLLAWRRVDTETIQGTAN